MSLTFAIILIAFGLVLLVLEILVIPGGVVGVLALCIMAYGVYSVYENEGTIAGHITAATTIIFTVGLVIYSLKSGVWKRVTLTSVLDGRANQSHESTLKPGDIGTALSDIRPMGTALFGDEKYEVSSEGDKIPVHSRVEIIKIEGYKIYVTQTDK